MKDRTLQGKWLGSSHHVLVMVGDIFIILTFAFAGLALLSALFPRSRSQSARYAIGACTLLFILSMCLVAKQSSSYAGEPDGIFWSLGDGMMVALSSLAALLLVFSLVLPALRQT